MRKSKMTISDKNSQSLAALRQQVSGIVEDHHELADIVSKLAGEMRAGFAALNTKLDNQMAPKWGVILSGLSLVLGILVAIGALAYMPVKGDIDNLKTAQQRDFSQLIQRDQRIWDEIIKNMRSLSYMEGRAAAESRKP